MQSSRKLRSLDYGLFKAFAGGPARTPADGQLVYYFPEGHAEHTLSPLDFSFLLRSPPFFLCRVTSVSFFAHPESDEVYANISLDPCPSNATNIYASPSPSLGDGRTVVSSFSKVLTPSDANNGGGFSVPRYCADSLFPPLDYNVEPPVQNLSVFDVHGNNWVFRHIFRGTPRRHLLTTGWSKFVNKKKLIAGDSVVFSRDLTGQIFVGIRRTSRTFGGRFPIPTEMKLEHDESSWDKEGLSRRTTCTISPTSVIQAVRSVVAGRPFEVLYYPRTGWPEFVVAMESVVVAMALPWKPGMRIRMAMETEESSSAKWFQGTVSCVALPEDGQWARSPWRMLQVNWNEEGVLHNLKAVNPWEVELISTNSQYTVTKDHSDFVGIGIRVEEEECTVVPMTGLASTELGSLTSSLSNLKESPFGRQGARHILSSSSSYFVPRSRNQLITENTCVIDIWSEDMSRSEVVALPEESNHQSVVKIFGTLACNPTRNPSKGTIQLFGNIIHINELAETNTSTDFPISFPQKRLLEGQHKIPAGSL